MLTISSSFQFYSQYPNGEYDKFSLHGACPVLNNGTKWAANLVRKTATLDEYEAFSLYAPKESHVLDFLFSRPRSGCGTRLVQSMIWLPDYLGRRPRSALSSSND